MRIKSTDEVGRVVALLDEEFILVQMGNDEIPVLIDELEHPYLKWFLEKEKSRKNIYVDDIKPETKKSIENALGPGIYWILRPVYREDVYEEHVHRFEMFFQNQFDEVFEFEAFLFSGDKEIFSLKNCLYGKSHFKFFTVDFEKVAHGTSLKMKFIRNVKKRKLLYEKQIRLNAKSLYKRVMEMEQENKALITIPVFQPEDLAMKWVIPEQPFSVERSVQSYYRMREATKIPCLDLHIEKLHKTPERLNQDELLDFQLKKFVKWLENWHARGSADVLEIIHGIGDGILKSKIFSICDQTIWIKKYVCSTENPGKTMIYLE